MPGLHLFQVASEVVLARQGEHAWEVVDPLVWLHLVQSVHRDAAVRPEQIPLLTVAAVLIVRSHLRREVIAYAIVGRVG